METNEIAASVAIATEPGEIRDSWHHVFDLVEQLPANEWCLIGGMMVQIHANRYGDPSLTRATEDVDILGDSRAQTNVIEHIGQLLRRLRYEPQASGSRDGLSVIYRFVNPQGQIVDLLAPDGLKKTPYAVRGSETIQVKGGTQALRRIAGPIATI